ncbi:MAG: AzlD domain-containing protein [Pseudomonadota bacterium]
MSEFFLDPSVQLIAVCAFVTYLTRAGGHVIMSRFGSINHRIEAALDAVPTAVLAALVAPSFLTKGPAEAVALIIAGVVALRYSLTISVLAGLLTVVALRHVIG